MLTSTSGLEISRSLLTSIKPGNIPQALFEIARGAVELLEVLRLQRVLIQAPALLAADAHQRRILEVRLYARDLVHQGPQLVHDLFRRGFPLGAGFQANLQIAGVAGALFPPPPVREKYASTFGFWAMTAFTCCCKRPMMSKEASWENSVDALI